MIIDDKFKLNAGPTIIVIKEKNKLKNNGIKISPKGIKNLKFSSNVNEFVIQCMLLKKKLNPKIVPNIKRFFLYGFFLYLLLDFFFIKMIK